MRSMFPLAPGDTSADALPACRRRSRAPAPSPGTDRASDAYSASEQRGDRDLDVVPPRTRPASASRRPPLSAAATPSISTQSSSRPWTRICSTSRTSTPCARQRGKEPLGDTRPVLAAHRHQVGSAHAAHGTAIVLPRRPSSRSSTQPWPATQRRMILAGTPATTQRSGNDAPHDGPGRHHHMLADLGPRQDDDVGPQPAARADAHGRLGRPLPTDRARSGRRRRGSGR